MADDLSKATEGGEQTSTNTNVVKLASQERSELVERKATCPFLGTAIATNRLPVRNSLTQPLASIDDVVRLGNSGGGDLGTVLKFFAQGNHAFMPGAADKLDQPVPAGSFSLDLPGSQGSHPGHSGILQGNPSMLGSGRFSQENFDRLTLRAHDGLLKRSDIAKFIAENLNRDPAASILSVKKLVASALGSFEQAIPAAIESLANVFKGTQDTDQQRKLVEELTAGARSSNLVGSAGEFGLLLAFLQHKPDSITVDGEPAVSVEDLRLMFKEKRFPEGWEAWPKNASDWIRHTLALAFDAEKELGL